MNMIDQLALVMSLSPILRPLVLTPPAPPCAASAIFGLRLRLYVLPAEPAPSPAPPPPPPLRDFRVGDTDCCDPAQEDVADVEVSASLAGTAAAAAAAAFFPQPGPQPERLMLNRRSSSSFTLRERRLFSSLSFWTCGI